MKRRRVEGFRISIILGFRVLFSGLMTFWGLVEQGNVFYPGVIGMLFSYSLPTTIKMSCKWVLGMSSQKQQGPMGVD